MTKKNMAVLVVVLLLAVVALYRDFGQAKESLPAQTAAKAQYNAPAFTLKGLDGNTYSVGGKRDKPMLLNFWASWCSPCEEEAPDLARLYEKYKDQLDLYAVNVTGNDDVKSARAFAERYRFGFPVLLDEKLEAAELYRFQVIPTSFLIDRNGVVVEMINLLEPKELEKKLKKLIEM
ncbi:peroxiredoxin family protein [Gorillibacterium sp. sgz5001074]|uniref:peroxiredoxin family protein n=1 Tax=Gorillibacterium sp. sgz5001074 TaxID=3446695 RepID=UPI003F67A9D1